jgi:hypothetical protein
VKSDTDVVRERKMTRAQVLKKRVGEVDHFVKNIESGKEIE